jgi:hypothetical protein
MNADLAKAMRTAGTGTTQPAEWWKHLIDRLMAEFQFCIGEPCSSDGESVVKDDESSFIAWICPGGSTTSLLSTTWSGVLEGGLVAGQELAASLSVFVFHNQSKQRVCTIDGRSFNLFSFDVETVEWQYRDWQKDETGEWEGVAFPDGRGR